MEKVEYFIVLFGVVIISFMVVSVVYQQLYLQNIPVSDQTLEQCIGLGKRYRDGINIVFFADRKEVAKKYKDYLLNFDPFKDHQERFNFYYVNGYSPYCEIYKGIALLCYSRELLRKAGSCPNDYVVVIDEKPSEIRSSSYMNVMSINSRHPLTVFPHEFGHAFASLAEEYVPAKIPKNSPGNCAASCSDFGGKNDGCFQGCSLTEYSRSIDKGVMRSLYSEDYGSYNKAILVSKIFGYQRSSATVLGSAINEPENCAEEEYHLVEFRPQEGIVNSELVKGCVGGSGSGRFSYQLRVREDIIAVGGFDPELIFTDGDHATEQGINGETYENKVSVYTDKPPVEGEDIEGETFQKDVVPVILKVSELPISEEELEEKAPVLEILGPEGETLVSMNLCREVKGDANGDKRVDASDIVHIKNYVQHGDLVVCEENADFTNDGVIDWKDASAISEFLYAEPLGPDFVSPSPEAGVSISAEVSPSAEESASLSVSPSPSPSPPESASPSPVESASPSASV